MRSPESCRTWYTRCVWRGNCVIVVCTSKQDNNQSLFWILWLGAWAENPLKNDILLVFFFLEQKFLFTIVVVLVVSEVMVLPVVCLLFIWQQRTHSCGFRFSWMSKLLTSFLSLFGYFYLGFCGFQLILLIVCLRVFKMFWKRSSSSAAQWGNCSEICLQKLSVLFVEPVVIPHT